MAGFSSHPFSKRVIKLVHAAETAKAASLPPSPPAATATSSSSSSPSVVSKRKGPTFPLLVVVSAVPAMVVNEGSPSSTALQTQSQDSLEWVATVSLERENISSEKIRNYLARVLEIHESRFCVSEEMDVNGDTSPSDVGAVSAVEQRSGESTDQTISTQ